MEEMTDFEARETIEDEAAAVRGCAVIIAVMAASAESGTMHRYAPEALDVVKERLYTAADNLSKTV